MSGTISVLAGQPCHLAGAATPWVHARLAGPRRSARVVHAGPDAVYVDDGRGCLGVLAAHASGVPCGIRTPVQHLPPEAREAPASVGGGRLQLGEFEVTVGRIRDALVPALSRAARSWAAELLSGGPSDLNAVREELPPDALGALARQHPSAVSRLLGRGSGLTPVGDDVLAAWMATLFAARDPARRPVVAAVSRSAPAATTTLSRSLLGCAARGEALPELRALLAAAEAEDATALRTAVRRLLAVGHTSGAGLLLGLVLALPATGAR